GPSSQAGGLRSLSAAGSSSPRTRIRCRIIAGAPMRRSGPRAGPSDPLLLARGRSGNPSEGFPSFRALWGFPQQRWRKSRGRVEGLQPKSESVFRESLSVFRDPQKREFQIGGREKQVWIPLDRGRVSL